MPIELLKLLKEHFELFQKTLNEENEKLKKLYEDKQVLNYLKLYRCYRPHIIQTFYFEEDAMDAVLIHHRIDKDYDSIYIDNGLYLVTSTDPKGLGSTARLIKESDLEYINKIIKNSSNPLVKQNIMHDYIGLESGLCNKNITVENKTIIKLPSLTKKEEEITPIQNDTKIDLKKVNATYLDENKEYLSIFAVLRAQFFLKMIEENPEDVLAYYRNMDNWSQIDKNIGNYYIKKKKNKELVIKKIQNL